LLQIQSGAIGRFAFGMVVLLVMAACNRMQPIYNVVDRPIPSQTQNLSLDEIGRNIVIAGTRHHWRFDRLAPGQLRASYSEKTYEAVVLISFTQQAYSIHLDQTVNLKENGDEIHRTYNRWVMNLERDIDDQLSRAGLGVK